MIIAIRLFKKLTLISALLLAISVIAKGNEEELQNETIGKNLQEQLLILDRQVDQAYRYTDTGFLSNIFSDDLIYVHSGANPIETKTEALNNMPPPSKTDWERDKMTVRIYGITAMVAGFLRVEFEAYGVLTYHLHRVYIKEADSWKLVSQHVTRHISPSSSGSQKAG